MQAKAFVRADGPSSIKLEMDRSSVSGGYNLTDENIRYSSTCPKQSSQLIDILNTWILIICIFIVSNLLFLSAVILYFRKMFLWLQQQEKHTKTLYKASAIVLTCVNSIVLTLDVTFMIRDTIKDTDDGPMQSIVLMFITGAKAPLVLFILIIETPVICFYTHGDNTDNVLNKKRYRIAHAFALCQIIWFGHRLVTDAIISIVFFIIAPAQTLGVVTLLLSVIASAIAFVAIILHNRFNGCNRKYCIFLFCASLNGIMVCGLLFVITLLFIVFVDNGLKSAGMGGLILSLVPPFTVFAIGLFVNQKYFRSTTSTASVNTTTEPQETHQTTAIQSGDETETQPLLGGPQATT